MGIKSKITLIFFTYIFSDIFSVIVAVSFTVELLAV